MGRLGQRARAARRVDARHGRGGSLLIVPPDSDAWRESIVQPDSVRGVAAVFASCRADAGNGRRTSGRSVAGCARARPWQAIAGLTAVDGAAIITENYELLAFGAKIQRRRGAAPVESVTVTEPIEGGVPTVIERRAAWRHAASVSCAVRPRSTQRHCAGRISGSALHRLRVVPVRRERARASRRSAAGLIRYARIDRTSTQPPVSVRRASSPPPCACAMRAAAARPIPAGIPPGRSHHSKSVNREN